MTNNRLRQSIKLSIWAVLLISISSTAAIASNSLKKELIKAANVKESGKYVRTRFLESAKKPFTDKSKKKALIIGDSHAQDFYNSVLESKLLADYQISTRSIPTQCQVYLGNNLNQFIAPKDTAFCAKSDSLAKAKRQIAEADLIILVANWKEWSAKELPQTIKNMQLNSKQKVVVIGRKSFGKVSVRKYLRMPEDKLKTLRNKPDDRQQNISSIMSESLDKDVLIELQDLVCGSTKTCPIFTDELKLISFDGGHLTKDGARYVGKVLFEKSPLGKL